MRYLVVSGSYKQEVEADDFCAACAAAFSICLPYMIGEIVSVRTKNERKKSGWNAAAYALTSRVLLDIGLSHLYIHGKRRFVLNTDSPNVEKVQK